MNGGNIMYNRIKNKLHTSMIWYLPIKMIEGLIGLLTIKVYTSLIAPEIYGHYSIINPTINIIFLIGLGWITKAAVRFVKEYSYSKKDIEKFYSTIFLTWFIGSIVIAFLLSITKWLIPNIFGDMSFTLGLIVIFVFFSYGFNQIIVTLLLYINKKMLNVMLLFVGALMKLVLTVALIKINGQSVNAIFISHGLIDCLIGLVAFANIKGFSYMKLKAYSFDTIIKFFSFGYPLLGVGLTMYILNVSDRYVIKYFWGKAYVGIYSPNYSIAAALLTMILVGLNKSIYIQILNTWNSGDKEETSKKVSLGIKTYLMIALPAASGLFMVADNVAKIFIDSNYYEGHAIIGIVALGMFFMGLTDYCNKGWELTANTINILMNSAIAALINVVLNVILVPRYGYIMAAYTTLASFFCYFILSYLRRSKEINIKIGMKSIISILFANFSMVVFVWGLKQLLDVNFPVLLLIVFGGSMIYFGILYMLKEIKINKKN